MTDPVEELRARAAAWLADDPDAADAATVAAWLADDDDEAVTRAFARPLTFGTAGLRGPIGPGPGAMNRAVVRRMAAGLCAWLDDAGHDGPVVVGRDARHGSAALAAEVAGTVAGAGRDVLLLPGPQPTPLAAFACRHLAAAAGVVVTASHNPPADNGAKVYGPGGAQIAPPVDAEIAARTTRVGPLRQVPHVPVPLDGDGVLPPAVRLVGDEVTAAYVDAVAGLRRVPVVPALEVAHTALHGVGWPLLARTLVRSGLGEPVTVAVQRDPDPDFPTVAFPNPEEPGAMDAVLALAADVDADLALANDPDADRLAVAVPARGRWRVLTGDEVGLLLADHALGHPRPEEDPAARLLVSTVVSSSVTRRLAEVRGVHHVTTLTGFKWLARATVERPDLVPVLGYEEALGYRVGDVVADKDGISAAVAVVEAAGALAAAGSDLAGRLAELAVELGLHRNRQRSLRYEGLDGPDRMAAAVGRVRATPPTSLGGRPVTEVVDLARGERLPPTDAVVVHAGGTEVPGSVRIVVRPSGTEPKLKLYGQVVLDVAAVGDVPARTAEADVLLDEVLSEVAGLLT